MFTCLEEHTWQTSVHAQPPSRLARYQSMSNAKLIQELHDRLYEDRAGVDCAHKPRDLANGYGDSSLSVATSFAHCLDVANRRLSLVSMRHALSIAYELGRRGGAVSVRRCIDDPEAAATFFSYYAKPGTPEHFWILLLDAKNRLLSTRVLSRGTLSATAIGVREVVDAALSAHAVGIIALHNHPSGDPTPSAADISLTKRLAQGLALFDIACIDHVVVGEGGRFYSLRGHGDFSTEL